MSLRYAIGIGILPLLWLSRLAIVDSFGLVSFRVLAAAVAIPLSIFLLAVWAMEAPLKDPISFRTWAIPLAIALMLAASFTPEPVLLCGIVLTVLLIAGTAAIHWRPFVIPSTTPSAPTSTPPSERP